MSKHLRCAAAMVVIALVPAAAALAAKPKDGKVYTGDTAHEQLPVKVTVAQNGKTVKLSIPDAPLYCQGGGGPVTQSTKPAPVSSTGHFSGTIKYVFRGKVAYKVTFKGYFATSKVATGTVRSEYITKSCDGSTAWTAEIL